MESLTLLVCSPPRLFNDHIPRQVRPLNQWWESYYCHNTLALDKLQQWPCWQVGGRMGESQLQISQSPTLLTRSWVVFMNKHFSVLCLWLNSRLLRRFILTVSSRYIVVFRGRICWPSFSLPYWSLNVKRQILKIQHNVKTFNRFLDNISPLLAKLSRDSLTQVHGSPLCL